MTSRAADTTTRDRTAGFDAEAARADFPILAREVHGKPLVYLDNAATTQKPSAVIDAVAGCYREVNSNVHRGVHWLSQQATERYEDARRRIGRFLNAESIREIIFVRGTTEAINLVAQSYARPRVGEGDEILISAIEHHSNIVPWQILCQQTGATLKVIPVGDDGALLLDAYEKLLNERTKLVGLVHVSNALGTVNPVAEMAAMARKVGAAVLIDGAQSAPHVPLDVRGIDCDFFAFSGHKIYGPTGIGVLYGRESLLEEMPPYQGGGDMITSVTFEKTTYNELPYKFEAGTPNIAGVIGLGAAIDYVKGLGVEAIAAHEADLLDYGTQRLGEIDGMRMIGTAEHKAGVLSFVLEGIHPHDVGTILDMEGVAVRTGHHCAQPVMDRFGVPATVRASLGLYNTRSDIDALVRALGKVSEVFS